ncbi:hypothetical protein L1049_027445 [Liquidambar formosana]|uniref:FHA domain-containing protein n=1 Tax=Liquidambar formosana TaxID=63359 RepID=A0AAP0RIS8_LIQFO
MKKLKEESCMMIKRRRGEEDEDDDDDDDDLGSRRKKWRDVARAAFIYLKTFDVPLFSRTTASPCHLIRLDPGRPYTLGRSTRFCDFLYHDPRVSNLHCQIFFDALRRKLFILDGAFLFPASASASFVCEYLNKLVETEQLNECFEVVRPSLNGVFVNGVRIAKGMVAQLSAGDEVSLVCGNQGFCSLGIRIGFFIERIVLTGEVVLGSNEIALETSRGPPLSPILNTRTFASGSPHYAFSTGRTKFLLSQCRRILRSDDPISYIRRCAILDGVMKGTYPCGGRVNQYPGFAPTNILEYPVGGEQEVNISAHVFGKEPLPCESSQTDQNPEITRASAIQLSSIIGTSYACVHDDHIHQIDDVGVHFENAMAHDKPKALLLNSFGKESAPHSDGVVQKNSCGISCSPPGKKFYLNSLKFMDHSLLEQRPVISLPELLYPVESLSRIFIATFTSDILWFLSYCEIPSHMPVTIACHDTERCWSSSPDKRTSVPYSDFPNLVVVYPQFPEAVAFGKDRKKQGIACHHPKLLVFLREDSIRVIITSANLVEKQVIT